MGSNDLIQKKIKHNKFSSLKMMAFISFFILALICLKNSNTIKNNLLRILEEDIREEGENEICETTSIIYKYDLNELKNLNKEDLKLGEDIEFNFCKNIDNKDSSCIYKDTRLSGNINGETNSKNKIKVLEEKKIIGLYLAAGDKCNSDQNKNYKININLTCNNNNDSFIIYEKNFSHNSSCDLYFKAYTKHACGVERAYFRILAGVLMIILGFLVGILGYKEIRIGLFIIIIVGCSALTYFLIELFGTFTINAISIVVECVLLVCGIIIYILLIKKKKDFYARIYMLIIGGLCCYLIGDLVYKFIFAMIETSYQELIRTIVLIVSSLIGVALGFFLPKYTCIIGSSIIGAYLIMRGISFFLQEVVPYISEQLLFELAISGNFDQIKDKIWGLFLIYPAILIIFIIILIIVQIKLNPNWKEANYKDLDQLIEKPKDLSNINYMGDIGGDDEGETKE